MDIDCQPIDETKSFACKYCKHTWTARKDTIPKNCPKCRRIVRQTPTLTIPEIGRGAELKKELIIEQEYLAAKKTVEAWEAKHGGPGSLKQAISKLARMMNVAPEEFLEKKLWTTKTDEELGNMFLA